MDEAANKDKRILHPVSPEKMRQALEAGTRKLESVQQQLVPQTADDEPKEHPEQSD